MKRPIIFPFLLFIVLLNSCTEEIHLKLDKSETKLVVEGYFSNDTLAHPVRLSKSADYFANKPLEPVSGALITITDGTSTFPLFENSGNPGLYETAPDVYGIPGHRYTLNIHGVDINSDGIDENYSASGNLNPLGHLDSIQVVYKKLFYQNIWQVNYFGQDPVESTDFYLFRTWKNRVLVKDTLLEVNITDDELFNGKYTAGATVQYLFEDKPGEKVENGDTISLEVQSITKEYFQFINDLMFESHGADPFGGQPANVSTNLSEGAVGFFSTFSSDRVDKIYKEE
jgi:hypothetical protein